MTMERYSGKVMSVMQYRKITSTANQRIREAVQIGEKRAGSRHDAFIIEGPHLVEMALHAGVEIREVFVTESFSARKEHEDLLERIAKLTGKTYEVSEHILRKITDTERPQGIAAIVSYNAKELGSLHFPNKTFLVVLDGIQDPGNLGTIIRTADAAGADAIILLPGTCDAFMPKAIRATAGSIFNIPVIHTGLGACLKSLREKKIPLAITTAAAGNTIYDTDLSGPVAIAFGNEAHGVGSSLKKAADISLKVPIFGNAESLNVATAAAICLYEVVRQRRNQ